MKEGDTEILIECVKYERSEDFKLHVDTGWSWRHVRVWPATLDRLEKEGFLTTKTHNESYHGYGVTALGRQVVTGSLLDPINGTEASANQKTAVCETDIWCPTNQARNRSPLRDASMVGD